VREVCSRLAFGHMLLVVLVVSGVVLCPVLVCVCVVLCPVLVGECGLLVKYKIRISQRHFFKIYNHRFPSSL
jgi:hypothetical protein